MALNYKGNLSGEDLNIAIVVSRFNEFVTLRLLNGAKAALSKHGVPEDHLIVVDDGAGDSADSDTDVDAGC